MDLNAQLLAAHAAGDTQALVRLYTLAADAAEGDTGARCFFLTQAYIYALDHGASEAEALRQRLIDEGREPTD